MGKRIIIDDDDDDDDDDDELLAVPHSFSLLSPAAPAVGTPPPANGAGNLSYYHVSPLGMNFVSRECMSRLLLLLTQDPMIAGTADVIVIEDSFPNDVGSSDPDDSIIPSTSDVIVIVGSPCPQAAAAIKPRFCSRPHIPHSRYRNTIRPAPLRSPYVGHSYSSDSGSSDPDDPVSRAARRAAVRAARRAAVRVGTKITAQRSSQHPRTIADFFRPISSAEYRNQVAAETQVDIMDLRSVVPLPATDIVDAADDVEYDLVSLPKRQRHGYEIDDFVVATSESESDYSHSSCP